MRIVFLAVNILQELPTKEGWRFLREASGEGADKDEFVGRHLSSEAFHEQFMMSKLGSSILDKLDSPIKSEGDKVIEKMVSQKYANSWYRSFYLLLKRELLLWWRDKVRLQ